MKIYLLMCFSSKKGHMEEALPVVYIEYKMKHTGFFVTRVRHNIQHSNVTNGEINHLYFSGTTGQQQCGGNSQSTSSQRLASMTRCELVLVGTYFP